MSLRKALLAATVLSLPLAAQAQPVSGLYVGAGVGANFRMDTSGSGVKVTSNNPGWVGLGSIGYGFGNGLRAELEGNYRSNNVNRFAVGGVRTTLPAGITRTYGAMVNVLYDFNIGGPLTPYLGAGVGYSWVESRRVTGRSGTSTLRMNDTDGRFAYQGIAGVAYSMYDMVPGLSLTLEYRFMGNLDNEMPLRTTTAAGVTTSRNVNQTNYNHSVLLGVRYAFGVAPAVVAPPPAPPPAAARTYLVFFDWNRADLTDRARQIIAQAAEAARGTQTTRLEVSGHADRSGTPQYNQALSRRRAEAVAAELVRRGINRNEISIQAFGESRPLVPTADGVREPQNRRVEIVLK